jgi:hypothetical protein
VAPAIAATVKRGPHKPVVGVFMRSAATGGARQDSVLRLPEPAVIALSVRGLRRLRRTGRNRR